MKNGNWLKSLLSLLLVISVFTPIQAYAFFDSDAELELKQRGIKVDYWNNLSGNDTWEVHFIPEDTRVFFDFINDFIPIVGPMMKNAYYAESPWEVVVENGKEGIYEAGSLIIGGKFFEGVEAIRKINDVKSNIETVEKMIKTFTPSEQYPDSYAIEAIKILNYGLIAEEGGTVSTDDWIILNIPYMDGIFNDGDKFTWMENGKQLNENIQRFDTYLNIINGENLSLLDGPVIPIIKTDNSYGYGKATEKDLEQILFDIYQILKGQDPVYFKYYSPFLVSTYYAAKAGFEENIKRSMEELEEIEKELKGEYPMEPFRWESRRNVDPNHDWTITFNAILDESTINTNNIFIMHEDKNVDGITVHRNTDRESVTIKAPADGFKHGDTYVLHINDSIQSADGNTLTQPIVMEFTIKEDNEPEPVNDIVIFEDKYLEKSVKHTLEIENNTPVTKEKITELTKLLGYGTGPDENIKSLSGLEYAINLEVLELRKDSISDLTPLSNLTNLVRVNFQNSNISDVSPLSGLPNLKHISIDGNNVSTLSSLQELPNLESLSFAYNEISSLHGIAAFPNLENLNLDGNDLSVINEIGHFTNLDVLNLNQNKITDIEPLSSLTSLVYLHLDDNRVQDLTPLSNLTELNTLSLEKNQITDISPLKNHTYIRELYFDYNNVSTIDVVSQLTNLRTIRFSFNNVSDLSPLENLKNLQIIYADYNPLSPESLELLEEVRSK
ncbi:leucine-rich repeat domain-containing protein [Bacillus dakarensis]|uniref:leucine-rich repeat domain-containing protein n=1 Tax=Robertmurraya dakarensis TaxID=1926278 RepID=UPI0009813756|nr:leucine-rich repeat domain-containing protein [Bacillus dakarensis]